MTKLFIIDRRNPWMPIKEIETEIFTGKRAWVKIDGVIRHLVGSTAFFTEASANVARIGHATRIAENDYQRYYHRWRYEKSIRFLEDRGIHVHSKVHYGKNRRNKA